MKITQQDIAHLADDDIRRMVVAIVDNLDGMEHAALGDFYRRIAAALVRARRERARLFELAAAEVANGDQAGALVAPASDPIADALDGLRERIWEAERGGDAA